MPDQIQWKKGEASDTAWPIGDPTKPGACLEFIKWHPGHFSHPHYHSHARYAVVVDGTWWVSTSNVYDPDHNTVPYPKGSVLTDLVKGVHYDGAKPETGDGTVAIFMDCPLDEHPGRGQEVAGGLPQEIGNGGGDDQRRRHHQIGRAGRTGDVVQLPHAIGARKRAQRPHAVDQGDGAAR